MLLLTLLLLPLLVVGNVLVALDILDNLVNILLGDYLRGSVKRGGSRYRGGGNLANTINFKETVDQFSSETPPPRAEKKLVESIDIYYTS